MPDNTVSSNETVWLHESHYEVFADQAATDFLAVERDRVRTDRKAIKGVEDRVKERRRKIALDPDFQRRAVACLGDRGAALIAEACG